MHAFITAPAMAATPEEFLTDPEPLSPSLFLDLPPTPQDPAASDDVDLDFISRVLMEEDIDDKFFYQYPDHPALLSAQHPAASNDADLDFISRVLMEEDIDDKFFYQYPDHPALRSAQHPFAQIISDDSAATNTTSSAGNNSTSSSNDDMTNDSTTWPYDPIELSQLLRSPPYLDNMGLGLDSDFFPADDTKDLFFPGDGAGFDQTPALSKGADDDKNASFPAAGQNGGGTGIQNSVHFLNGGAEEEEAKQADGGRGSLPSAFFNGQTDGDMDMLNMAFLKGMEEASRFLPTNNTLFDAISDKPVLRDFTAGRVKEEDRTLIFGNGRGLKKRHDTDDLEAETGRNSKLMMPEQEEAGESEMFDEFMLHSFEICMKGMEDLHVAMGREAEKSRKAARGRWSTSEVVDLSTMLIHCAQAVATGDRRSANELLRQIKQHSSPTGDATQRLAHCFAKGLEARLAGTGSQVYQSLVAKRTSVVEYLKAYKLFMAASSFRKVCIVFATKTICNAVAGKSRLHIVDYNVQYGFQWPALLRLLAIRDGGPPEVRITGIDLPQPGFRPAYQIEETGRRLSKCAREFGVPFKFRAIAAKWEMVRAEDLDMDPDEVLVVNSQRGFSKLMDESVVMDSPSPRDVVLSNIQKMKPDVFIECAANGTYGAPFFVTRFREALFFYLAQFDMLAATIPRDNDERLFIERDIFGLCALNVIACEGADRVYRPETYKQRQVRNQRAGLRQLPLNPEVVKLVRDKVKNHYHKDFIIDVDQRWLLQGWKGRILYAMSTWVAEDD